MFEHALPRKDLFFLPLGGAGEIGMNLNLYAYEDQWLMVDLGITFGNELGIEIIMPDPGFIVEQRHKLKGLVLTHAHEDHIGAIPYLWDRLQCPMYATPFTATIIREKLKDVGLDPEDKLHEIPLSGSINLNPFKVEFLSLTHSIPEANALIIRTPAGVVVHTGDWKIDPEPLIGQKIDESKIQEIGDEGVLALICDSTNAFVAESAGSEASVREKMISFVKSQTHGRIIIACFASNIARLESGAVAAYESGRKPILIGRSMMRMNQVARANGYLKDLPAFMSEECLDDFSREETLIICTGSQGEARSALFRMVMGQYSRFKLTAGDTVIFSSRMIPGNEEAIREMQEILLDQGITVIDDNDMKDIHVSGHPGRADLKKMYEWTRPQILVPVHGRAAHMREQANFGLACGIPKAIVPRNGAMIRLDPQGPVVVKTVSNGRLALDGIKIVPLFGTQMRDRANLMKSGSLFVTIAFDKRGHLRQTPQITSLGVFEEKVNNQMIEELQDIVVEIIAQMESQDRQHIDTIIESVKRGCRRYINTVRAKKPLTIVHVIQ